MGDVGSFVGEIAAGAVGVDMAAKKLGFSNGVIKPVVDSVARSTGFKEPFDSVKNPSANVNNPNPKDTFDKEAKNTGSEHKSPPKRNVAVQSMPDHPSRSSIQKVAHLARLNLQHCLV